jgi:hypothetical protein
MEARIIVNNRREFYAFYQFIFRGKLLHFMARMKLRVTVQPVYQQSCLDVERQNVLSQVRSL